MRFTHTRLAEQGRSMTDAQLRRSRRLCAVTIGGSMALTLVMLCGQARRADAQLLTLDILNGQLLDLDARVTVDGTAITGLTGQIGVQANAVAALGGQLTAAVGAAAALDARVGMIEVGVSTNVGAVAVLGDRVDSAGTLLNDHGIRITANTAGLLALGDQVGVNGAGIADLSAGIAAGTVGIVRQPAGSGPIAIGAQTGGDAVGFAGTDGDRRLTGVAPGIVANDAVNRSQLGASAARTLGEATAYTDRSAAATLAQANSYTDQAIARGNRAMRREMDSVGAGAAALSGLPQSIVPGEGMIGAGIGGHGDAVALAVGLSKAFSAPHTPVIRAGASFDTQRGGVTYNAAVGLHF